MFYLSSTHTQIQTGGRTFIGERVGGKRKRKLRGLTGMSKTEIKRQLEAGVGFLVFYKSLYTTGSEGKFPCTNTSALFTF
jgi:hypothetical protein